MLFFLHELLPLVEVQRQQMRAVMLHTGITLCPAQKDGDGTAEQQQQSIGKADSRLDSSLASAVYRINELWLSNTFSTYFFLGEYVQRQAGRPCKWCLSR